MTPAAVSDYLSRRAGHPVVVESVERAAGGLSRETWFVSGPDVSYVFRCDLRGGVSSCPRPLSFEYEMHRRLPDLGLPVTRALWFEADAEVFGQPFYVRECVEGSSTIPGFDDPGPTGDAIRIETSREHVRRMAAVHLADWQAAGLGELMDIPPDKTRCASASVERLRRQHAELGLPMSPLTARAFDWFADRAPGNAPNISLCKGSNGAMQEVWRDGRIVALCDWELASLGDPANDWARCWGYLPTIEGRWSPRAAFDYYEELTGLHISEEALQFYRGLYWLEMTIVGLYAGRAVRHRTTMDARLAFLQSYSVHSAEMNLSQIMYG